MRLHETITATEVMTLLSGEAIGIFPTMILNGDSYYDLLVPLCSDYYMQHSNMKQITPYYERLRKFISENEDITQTAEEYIGTQIRERFKTKWEREYSLLHSSVYNPIADYEHTEHRVGDNEDKTTYNTTVKDDGATETNLTETYAGGTQNDVYGYNSIAPVGDNRSTNNNQTTTVGSPEHNTTENTSKKTGTETDTHDIDETITKSGRHSSASDLLNQEIEFRNRVKFFDIVFKDIDSIVCLEIY